MVTAAVQAAPPHPNGMKTGCSWEVEALPNPPTGGLGADRTHERRGALWRWDALVGPHPLPLSRARERGDQSRALGRPNAVEAALARMFCPPLNPRGEGMGKPGFPIPLRKLRPHLPAGGGGGKPGFPTPIAYFHVKEL